MGKLLALFRVAPLLFVLFVPLGCQRDQEYKREMAQMDREMRRNTAEIEAEILVQRTRYVRLKFGDVAAATYELCHTRRPTTEEHINQCKELEEKLKKADEEDAKHPW